MAGLIQRGGIFYISHRIDGREIRQSLHTDKRSEALKLKREFEYLKDRGEQPAPPRPPTTPTPAPQAEPITTAEFIAAYARHLKATKGHAVARRDIHILARSFGPIVPELVMGNAPTSPKTRKKISFVIATPPYIQQITPQIITTYLDAKRNGDMLAARSVNRIREVLRALFNHAIRQGALTTNPVHKVAKFKEPTPEIQYLSLEQIEKQLEALADHPTLQAMVAVYIYAGLRREEALWLTPGDVDLTAGVVRVRAKTIDGKSWQSKTGQNRVIPISTALRTYLVKHTPGDHWYFTAPEGERWSPDNFTATLRRVNGTKGLNWNAKIFRHTFASMLAKRGVSLFQIAKLLGNSHEVAAKYYADLVAEDMTDSVEFAPPPSPRIAPASTAVQAA